MKAQKRWGTTYVSETRPTQNMPTNAVTVPARSAAASAWSGAPSVCATNRYAESANGRVKVSGAILSRVSGANETVRVSNYWGNKRGTHAPT